MKIQYIAIWVFVFLTSCYKEVAVNENKNDAAIFELTVSPELQAYLYSSKDTAYVLEDPELSLLFNDHPLTLKDIRVRGRTTLDYRRKSFGVSLDNPIFVKEREGEEFKKLVRFKLISLSMDYTYINNRLAFDLLQQAGVMPLFYRYVEFFLNGENQGVYLLVEDPEQFFVEQGSEYILRRDYHHGIEDSEYEPMNHHIPREMYKARFKEIYSYLPDYQGRDIYDFLLQRLDLDHYFRKMGIDFLLQNGDYTDEVFFYAQVKQEVISYKIIPWDYDDIFSTHPHEVGRTWGIGKLFGIRSYSSQQDIYDDIGEKLIFSVEDDLDYAIARDSVLYTHFKSTLTPWLEELSQEDIGALFRRVEEELTPYYQDEEVILQSQYDENPTSLVLWQKNMSEKEMFVKERLVYMKNQLNLEY